MSRTFSIVMGALAVVGLALGGIAYASIPDGDNVIHGCYGNSNGQLRVIDDAQSTCKNNETPLSWNAQGPPGPSGASHAYQASDPNLIAPLPNTPTQILSLSLPPGNYVVVAKTNAVVFQNSVRCTLDAGVQLDQTDVQDDVRGVAVARSDRSAHKCHHALDELPEHDQRLSWRRRGSVLAARRDGS